ncbi:MAG: hypothetical protein V4787_02875 [Pseudomonadota bacterium]
MKRSQISQFLAFLMICLMLGYSASPRADDIDIYVDNSTNDGIPNVLFVMDTGANFSSSAAVPCTAYGSGGAPSLGNTAGGIEQCALVDAINSLGDGTVNIGILVNNNNNFGTDVRSSGDLAYHETCMGTYGGCVVRKLALMNATNKASLINFIKSWKTSGTSSATEFNVKSGGDRTAGTMQEAWAYYNGKVGMSGKSYSSSILASGCQKNFVIFIGNAFTVSGTPGDGGSESPYNGTYGLTASQTGANATQTAKISETVSFDPQTCGVSSIAASTNASNWSENWADEWARVMYQQDMGTSIQEGKQNITTYTIGVVNDTSCKADYPALLTTMAKYGGGKYFKTGTASEVRDALATILNEVQAVNSVFSSASLPVSVNAQGTYLNQIFLGMFRPDASAAPRWMGNLKQYQLVKSKSNAAVNVLGDKNGNDAISSSGTGFISPNAVSFWSYRTDTDLPDSAGGFWKNDKKGVPETGYDSPDGEVVEKGGVAQQLRKENLINNYTTAAGTSTNPRRLYTYCPAGTSCVPALTDPTNAFTTTNTSIGASAFGDSSTTKITSIVRTGTSALVTTSNDHGITTGSTISITGATPADYNVTQSVTANSSNTFTITGFTDYPTTPSANTYLVTSAAASTVAVNSITRTVSTTGKNTETVTVTTASPHGFTTASNLVITGASPTTYNFSGTPLTASGSSLTFNVAIQPTAPAANSYGVALSSSSYPAITNVTLTNPATGQINGTTSTAHSFHAGETVKITLATDNKYNGTFTISSMPTSTTFIITGAGASVKNMASNTGTVTPDVSVKTITSLTRTTTAVTGATATATISTSNWINSAVNSTKTVSITKISGTAGSETAYLVSNVTATCLVAGCTQFSYPITITPAETATGTMVLGLAGSTGVSLTAGAITRVGGTSTATVTGITANTFTNGQSVVITGTGTALNESDYAGTWTISCTAPCTTFKFGPVILTPATPATGSNMQVFSSSTPPDKNTIVNWVRGMDNYGDEKGPGGTVTVRPSIHGDVLHSRPWVINYGDTARGIVAFYGSNDGIYRAINGSQTASIGTVPPGGELWGMIVPEHYGSLNRLRLNSPELKFPSTTLATAQLKDYFVDGPTTAYQQLNSAGTAIAKAYLYLTMRRGGRMLYALDVTTPTAPSVLWVLNSSTTGFEEMGQTWSRPKVTVLQSKPTIRALVFGAGYDASQDSEPPGTDAAGRGIFIVNAETGALIWSASPTCTSSATCRNVPGMIYSIPSEITVVDRDGDLLTDKLYFGDMGGNIWRADVADANSANWTVTKVAALGCATGVCSAGTTPRKFFFPPAHIPIKVGGTSGAYDILAIGSGDREHPLKNTATGSAYNVQDKFFMIRDMGTTLSTPSTSNVTMATLVNATSFGASNTVYDNSQDGFYISLATGEKTVNAPTVVSGEVFLATNRPVDKSNLCSANLGEAKAYAYSPFTGEYSSNVLPGGGLAPTAVAGLVTIKTGDVESVEKFCIGCGVTPTCNSALENCNPEVVVLKNMRRTYWYKK